MPVKSINELIAQANAGFPDNTTGLITPAILRQFVLDFLAAMAPAYGLLTATGPLVQALTPTPSLLVFSTAYDSNPAQTTTAVPASTITRAERGSSRITLNATFACLNNISVNFFLYRNGVNTGVKVTGVGRGALNPVSVSLVMLDYADPAPVYSIQVAAESAQSVTFTDLVFLLATVPVTSFT